jgi:hypothetical protein
METWIGKRLSIPASTAVRPADAVRFAASLTTVAAECNDFTAIFLAAFAAILRTIFDLTELPPGFTASFAGCTACFARRVGLCFLPAAALPFFDCERARRAGLLRCLVPELATTTLS